MNAPTSTMNMPAPARRSTLVTVLGWIAIAFGVLTACAALSQFQFFGILADAPPMSPNADPAIQEGLFRGFQGISLVNLAIAGFLIYAGYALWRRRNWARQTFIVLFALGIAGNVIGVALFTMFGSLFGQLGAAFGVMFVVLALFGLGVVVLFAWLIRKLRSPPVKSEFV